MKRLDKHWFYLMGCGVFIRLVLVVVFYRHVTIYPDSSGYNELAKRFSNLNLSGYIGQRSPGYPLIISLAFNQGVLVVIYQFLAGLGVTLLNYANLKALKFSSRSAFYISLSLSLLLDVLFYETAILTESFTLFFMSLSVYLLIKNQTNPSDKIVWGLGISLGMLTLIKPFYAFLPFLIYGMYFLKEPRWNRLFSRKLVIFIFPLIAYFGWSTVNKLNTGYFVSTTFFGLNIAQNCVRFAEKGPEEYQWISRPYVHYREKTKRENGDIAMSIWHAYNAGAFEKYHLSFPDLSHQLGEYAKATIARNPDDYFEQVGISWLDFWKPSIYWNYDAFNFPYANKIFLVLWYLQKGVLWLFRIGFLIMVPFIVARSLKTRKITPSFILMSLVVTASVLQALVTYGTNSRFSFPFEFLMIIVVCSVVKNYRSAKKPGAR